MQYIHSIDEIWYKCINCPMEHILFTSVCIQLPVIILHKYATKRYETTCNTIYFSQICFLLLHNDKISAYALISRILFDFKNCRFVQLLVNSWICLILKLTLNIQLFDHSSKKRNFRINFIHWPWFQEQFSLITFTSLNIMIYIDFINGTFVYFSLHFLYIFWNTEHLEPFKC